ncbi:MAG: secretin N-terminal domain-containing protein [Pseudomonadota bacterium]
MDKRNRLIGIAVALALSLSVGLLAASSARGQIPLDTGTASRMATDDRAGMGGSEKYDVSFRQASLREAFQFLAWVGGVNIVIPEGVEGMVNVSFRDIAIGDALAAIVKANALEYTVEGRVIRVGKSEQFKEGGEDLKTETFRLRYANAKDMQEKVKSLLSARGSVVSDERTNSLTVRELPANLENVRRFVSDVDIKDAQVLIESKILEATRTFSRSLGIQWGLTKGGDTSKVRVAGVTSVGQADSGRNLNVNLPATDPTSGLLIGSFFKGANLDVQILAAEQRGDVYIVSDPSIVTSNGKSANIRSGTTLLVQGSSTVNIGTSAGGQTQASNGLQQIETGIQLTVTPQITIHDFVKLDIKATTSEPDFARAVQGVPVIVDNTAATVVLVKDGETTVIGGLTRYFDALGKNRVPYFSRIPVLGNLFKSKTRTRENNQLMVFIKPTIIRVEGQEPAQMRVREFEERRAAMELEPILNPQKDAEKAEKKEELAKKRYGNKYVK